MHASRPLQRAKMARVTGRSVACVDAYLHSSLFLQDLVVSWSCRLLVLLLRLLLLRLMLCFCCFVVAVIVSAPAAASVLAAVLVGVDKIPGRFMEQ